MGIGLAVRWGASAVVRQRGLLPKGEALRQGEAVRWTGSTGYSTCRGFPHERLPLMVSRLKAQPRPALPTAAHLPSWSIGHR
ncbi:MAG: hypothetical protein KME31_01785 [Tolypothrix carrinoi HA7290-LM1]|nr:hypothetical protein [Tolypothrix carrinoi HA7290-LM1]